MTEQLGTVRADGDLMTLQFERRYDASPDEVWAAFTEPESISRWLFADAVLEPRIGGDFRLRWSENEVGGTVLVWEPPRTLEVEWNETNLRSILRIEITALENGAALALEHRNITTKNAAIGMGAGWHAHLEALGEILSGREASSERWWPRYEELRPTYEELVSTTATRRRET
jgi:uncharacterized protein YndB with AHSA1/START domain